MTHKQLLRMGNQRMVTYLFSRTLARLGIPRECWGPVAYYYWMTDGSIPRVDRERLMDDIRSGKLMKRHFFGPMRGGLMMEWLRAREAAR